MAGIPVSHPQPSPCGGSEELDQFCTRVFKKSDHNKADLACLRASRATVCPCLTLASPSSPPDAGLVLPDLSLSQSGVSMECERQLSEAAPNSGLCVHPHSKQSMGFPGRRGAGRAGPAQAVLTSARPSFPPHPKAGGGGAAVTRACADEGFGSTRNGRRR